MPTCHSSSSLLSFLCLYTHQHTDPADSILTTQETTLSLTPFLSTANKGNAPRQAELPEGSHAQQLCQPANGRADWTAGDLYIRRLSNQREAVHRKAVHLEGITRQWQNKEEPLQDSIKTVWSTPGCPVTPHRELGLPRQPQAAVGQQLHRPLSAEAHPGPPFEPSRASGGQRHPWLTGRFSTTSNRRDIYQADQSLTKRQGSRTARSAADLRYCVTIRLSLDCTTNSRL